jgi:hypothetical protein
MIVQVFDEFSIDVEILFNYLVFVLCTLSCSSLRRSVSVCFSSCFSFACIFRAGFICCICSSLRGNVRRNIRV